jgi:hypothetical protein
MKIMVRLLLKMNMMMIILLCSRFVKKYQEKFQNLPMKEILEEKLKIIFCQN